MTDTSTMTEEERADFGARLERLERRVRMITRALEDDLERSGPGGVVTEEEEAS